MVPGGVGPTGAHSIAQKAAQTRCDRTACQAMQSHSWGQARDKCVESQLKSPPQPFATVELPFRRPRGIRESGCPAGRYLVIVGATRPKPVFRGALELDPGPWRVAIAAPHLQRRKGLSKGGIAVAASMHDWADTDDQRSSEEKRTHAAQPLLAAMPSSHVAQALGEHEISLGRLCPIRFGRQHRNAPAAFRPGTLAAAGAQQLPQAPPGSPR